MLFICLGACLGALGRWGFSLLLNNAFPPLPPGTLLVNLLGSFLMGLFLGILANHPALTQYLRPIFIVGFLGSFTTFSTFAAEMGQLVQKGNIAWLSLGVVAHTAGSICLFLAGMYLGKILK